MVTIPDLTVKKKPDPTLEKDPDPDHNLDSRDSAGKFLILVSTLTISLIAGENSFFQRRNLARVNMGTGVRGVGYIPPPSSGILYVHCAL